MAIHGIAVDDRLAVSENPYRRLDAAAAILDDSDNESLRVAVGDQTMAFATPEELEAWSATVGVAEASVGPNTATNSATPQADPSSWVFGEKRVLWIRVDFSDAPGLPASDQEINDSMAKVSEYFRDVSRDRCSFKTTIVPGAFRLTGTKAALADVVGSESALYAEALALVRRYDSAHGATGLYDPDRYDRTVVLLPVASPYFWSGLGCVGAPGLWLNGTTAPGTVAHELGHNQGLLHSHAWQPTGSSTIAPGDHVEYGDEFDVMGTTFSFPVGHFNAKQKAKLGYLAQSETPTVTGSGVYRIYRHDTRGAAGVQAVAVSSGTDYEYWISYRRQSGFRRHIPERRRVGVDLHWDKCPSSFDGTILWGGGTYLLDSTPVPAGYTTDAPLAPGETLVDPVYGIAITPIAVGGSEPNHWIDVLVVLGDTSGNHDPTVTLSAPSGALMARTDTIFSAASSDPDGDTVYYHWDFGDGQIDSTAAWVNHRWLVGGTYDVTVTAIDGKGGQAKQTLSVKVADPLLGWTRRATGLVADGLCDIVYGGGRFVTIGGSSAAVSTDGQNWEAGSLGQWSFAFGVAYGAGRYVVVGLGSSGGRVAYSSDGYSWHAGTLPADAAELQKVAFGADRFVAVGAGGRIYTSLDGQIWTEAISGVTDDLCAVRFGGGVFVAVGADGRILTSSDGIAWNNRTPATPPGSFRGLAWVSGIWCADAWGETWISTDSIVWVCTAPMLHDWGRVGASAQWFWMPQDDGTVTLSKDGFTWSAPLVIDRRLSWGAVAEGNGTFVFVGAGGAIFQTQPLPVINTHPVDQAVNAGQTAVFTVVPSGGTAPALRWQRSPLGIGLWSDLENDAVYGGVTTAKLTVAAASLMNSDTFRCIASNSEFSVASNAAILTVYAAPVILDQPVSQIVIVGETVALTVAATGFPWPTYQWQKDSVDIAGEIFPILAFKSVQLSDAGRYRVNITNTLGTITSAIATLTAKAAPTPPVITTQPVPQTVLSGETVSFFVLATGNPAPIYQWKKGGVDVSGATGFSLTMRNVQSGDAGDYSVVLTNSAGHVTSHVVSLQVNTAPVITSQPTPQTVDVGGIAEFSVTATGSPTPTYKWQKAGVNIAGATAAIFKLAAVQKSDAGDYRVVVTNAAGTVTSKAAALTVASLAAPVITTQPRSLGLGAGQSGTLAVGVTGASSYQWYKGGMAIPGAIGSTFTLPSLGSSETGLYDVLVTGPGGAILSAPVVVGVVPAAGQRTAGAVATRAEWQDIHHPNGAIYDQFLLTGAAGTFTADPNQIARMSYLDEDNSIVQVEMSGAGAITVNLTNAAGPMAPALYNQRGIVYMKGRATIVLAGADATTHFTIYSVGTATNPGVTRADAPYSGWANVAAAGIISTDGKLGGIHQGNVAYQAAVGLTGLYAPTVTTVGGPVVVHGIAASDWAVPYLFFGVGGSVAVKIAGTDLAQPSGDSLTVGGLARVEMGAGQDSCGRAVGAVPVQGRLTDEAGADVTATLVVGP
ncbi:MAG: immunoglobulin domain-containing protein [Opitutaceae bacterium]|nr:immunoglobulin domain-containing protein [Opitutaceae bacterium]